MDVSPDLTDACLERIPLLPGIAIETAMFCYVNLANMDYTLLSAYLHK